MGTIGNSAFPLGFVFQWGCAVLRPVNWNVPPIRSRTRSIAARAVWGALGPAAKRILVHFRHKCLLDEFHNQWINQKTVDQKATSASLGGGGMAPLTPMAPPLICALKLGVATSQKGLVQQCWTCHHVINRTFLLRCWNACETNVFKVDDCDNFLFVTFAKKFANVLLGVCLSVCLSVCQPHLRTTDRIFMNILPQRYLYRQTRSD